MQGTKLFVIAGLFVAVALGGYWLGYQRGRNEAQPVTSGGAPTAKTETAWDYKTVECTNQRLQMSEWQQEGWLVLSVSGPATQQDGTISRTARLRRAKQ